MYIFETVPYHMLHVWKIYPLWVINGGNVGK